MKLVEPGDKVHIIDRRMFEGDVRRHFIGEVMDANEVAMIVRGFVFVYDGAQNEYSRRDTPRTRLISLTGAGQIINLLPRAADIEAARYADVDGRLTVTDGESFSLDINEFGSRR